MKRALFAIVALTLVALITVAQDATPSPPLPLATPLPEPALVTVNGEPAVVVPLPDEAPPAVVAAVAAQAAENVENITSGEISEAQATRDPAETMDTGSDWVIPTLGAVAAALVSYLLGMAVRATPNHQVPDLAESAIRHGATVAVYVVGWALLHSQFPALPQSWGAWVAMALTGSAGAGGAKSAADVVRWIGALRLARGVR